MISIVKVKCACCGSEMNCPPGVKSTPVHICANCFEKQPSALDKIHSGKVHIKLDPTYLADQPQGTLLGREDVYFDILFPIESTIVRHYRQNPKLKDRDII